MRIKHIIACTLAVSAVHAFGHTAEAALTLTSDGTALGFSLSTYFSDPTSYYRLLGVTTTASGNVIAASYATGNLYLLPDVDGQTPATITMQANIASKGTPYSVATVGGTTYYSPSSGTYYKVDTSTLALTPLTLSPSVTPYLGLYANQTKGTLISSSTSGLVEINPISGAVHTITSTFGFDGVTVSPDGMIAYGENGGNILAYDIASGTLLATYSGHGHGPDGTGVISGTSLNGDIVVNNNDGTVGLIDPATGNETVIATGGTRGDFVGPDLTNGTLFLASADAVERLSLAGAVIGGGPTPPVVVPPGAVPEPASLGILGFSLVGLVVAQQTCGRGRRKAGQTR